MISGSSSAQGGFVLIIHDIADYRAWKTIFDGAAAMRHAAGEIEYHLLAAQHDDRRIVHFSRWKSLDAARRFFESDELIEIRRKARVHAPDFHYLQQLEQGMLS